MWIWILILISIIDLQDAILESWVGAESYQSKNVQDSKKQTAGGATLF